MIVVLMGYMGSGKSTIGKELATVLNYKFLDLDDYIAMEEKTSITELFNSKGEIYFRKKESEYLNELLKSSEDLVLALGGGTPCYSDNINKLKSNDNIKLIYLKLSIPLLVKRLFDEREKRPLISHIDLESDLLEFVGKHLFERSSYYNQADYVITSDSKSKKDTLEAILMQLI